MRSVDSVMVYGLGYVGLPTAALMATSGYKVFGYDTNPRVRESLRCGNAHIKEAGLQTLLRAAIESGNLKLTDKPIPADSHIICVPTPVLDGKTDLTAVRKATEMVASVLRPNNLVIVESTVPPGTTKNLVARLLETESGLTAGKDFYLAYCPERVLPGRVLTELVQNDRLIGGYDKESAQVAASLYSRFVDGALIKCESLEAEIAKLAENTYRDVNIALANELSRICASLQTDVHRVIALANRHPRVNILRPGAGVGGHCIPVDPWMLTGFTETYLIQAARKVNDSQPIFIANSVSKILNSKGTIVLMGLTYKENVDDTRNAPSRVLTKELRKRGFAVRFCDPYITNFEEGEVLSVHAAVKDADMLLFVVAHKQWLRLDPKKIKNAMRRKTVYDATGKIDQGLWTDCGFDFYVLT